MNKKVSWYVSCSPRSPEKIQPELELLTEYENEYWRGKKGRQAQEGFAKDLKDFSNFKGATYEKETSFSTRDRVAPMKTYGFVYINKEGKLVITEAGKLLAKNKRPKEIFLKQLSKWQYPSPQHTGKEYPYPEWELNPLIFVLKVIKSVEYLTKLDIAIFCLTVTNNDALEKTIEEILKYREKLNLLDSHLERIKYREKYFYNKFLHIYADTKMIREGKAGKSKEQIIKTKMKNALDVADATTRYFRYTGLFVASKNKLVLNPMKLFLIDEVIKNSKIVENFNDVEEFYNYFGNPNFPTWEYEDEINLKSVTNDLIEQNNNLIDELKDFDTDLTREETYYKLYEETLNIYSNIEKLKDLHYDVQEQNIRLRKKHLQKDFLHIENIDRVRGLLFLYNEKQNHVASVIQEEFIASKNAVFEWLTWNGFIILGNAIEYKNNFVIDEELQPVSHAAGNQSDMEIEYEEFIILGEVTTSGGATQFKMEAEPVTRHYLNKLKEMKENNVHKELYCIFMAPKLNDNTFIEFQKYNINFNTKIVPLTLNHFISLIDAQKNKLLRNSSVNSTELKELLHNLYIATIEEVTFDEMKVNIDRIINEWGKRIVD